MWHDSRCEIFDLLILSRSEFLNYRFFVLVSLSLRCAIYIKKIFDVEKPEISFANLVLVFFFFCWIVVYLRVIRELFCVVHSGYMVSIGGLWIQGVQRMWASCVDSIAQITIDLWFIQLLKERAVSPIMVHNKRFWRLLTTTSSKFYLRTQSKWKIQHKENLFLMYFISSQKPANAHLC